MPKGFGCISNTIEINLCEDFTGKKFCSPLKYVFEHQSRDYSVGHQHHAEKLSPQIALNLK